MRFEAGIPTIVGALLTTLVCSSLAIGQEVSSQQLVDGLANPSRWLTYSGDYSGQRHSPLTQITSSNVQQLTVQWAFQTGVMGRFEATPIIVDGTIYVTGPGNYAWAIDGLTGRKIWTFQHALQDRPGTNVNRGFA